MIALTIFSDVVILSYFYVRFYHIFFVDLIAGTWLIWCTFMMYLTDYDYDVHDYDVRYCVQTHRLISFHCLTTC